MELWLVSPSAPGTTVRVARRAEDEGWHGLALFDSQNLSPDPYIELALAASATERLLLATGVTNPVTRHPAITSTAIATVHAESGGRALLGIGRGDSSLAHLGLDPAPIKVFRSYLQTVQRYLRGEAVPFDSSRGTPASTSGFAPSHHAEAVPDSRIRWLPADLPKVPVEVAATGPKMIAVGAVLADRLSFAVGADVGRLRWAIDTAFEARREAGLPAEGLPLGAYVPVFVHQDRATARAMIAGSVASVAHFSVMSGRVSGPASDAQRGVLETVHREYDMSRHFAHGSAQAAALSDEVIDTFGIAGPPSYCIERLQQMGELGVSKLLIMRGGLGADREAQRRSRELLSEQVIPALTSAFSAGR